jgi:hypothetical protein
MLHACFREATRVEKTYLDVVDSLGGAAIMRFPGTAIDVFGRNAIDTTVGDSNFGVVKAWQDPRNVQIGAKINF